MRGDMQATEAKEEKQLAQPRCKKMPRAPQAVQPEPVVKDDENTSGGAGARQAPVKRQAHSMVRATAQRSSARITASRSGKRKRSPLAAEGGDAAVAAVAAVVAGGAGAARAATGAQGVAASPGAPTTSSAGTASPSKLPCSPSLQPREVASRWRSGASMSSRCSRRSAAGRRLTQPPPSKPRRHAAPGGDTPPGQKSEGAETTATHAAIQW